ncbi:uncharacterized protein LOC120333426 isoform X2 [Styela clava]
MASHKFAPPPSSKRDPSIDYRYNANEETLNETERDLYENVTYEQPRAIQGNSNGGTSNNTIVETKTPKCTPINVVLSIAVVISIGLSVCGIILVIQVDNRLGRAIEKLSKTSTPASSCFRIKEGGQNQSGFYTIHPTSSPSFFKVFCDMESSGGGWTLVASVHKNESGVKYKYTGESIGTRDGYGLWENYLAFGTPENAHKKDFKSPAYFSLQSSDVMIWHVESNEEITNASQKAFLKYYTTTGFLRDYGGTLQSLYSQHYPLAQRNLGPSLKNSLTKMIEALNSSGEDIRSSVFQFYKYTYDFGGSVQNYIGDGGSDMFDGGNKIFYRIGDDPEVQVTYNEMYRNESHGVELLSSTSHPFNLLMWVENTDRSVSSFSLKAVSDAGADGRGSYSTYDGTTAIEDIILKFFAFNVYGTSDPSISTVFYYVYNRNISGSIASAEFKKSLWTNGTNTLQHEVTVTGSPKLFLLGYTLLSSQNGQKIPKSNITSVLSKILLHIKPELTCDGFPGSLLQPISYLRGSKNSVYNAIPDNEKLQTKPEFLQFRVYNRFGIPSALCYGIRTESCWPHNVCIGGPNVVKNKDDSHTIYTGWGGDNSTQVESTDTVLIFTR